VRLHCTTDNYARLYARWLVKPGTLLDLADYEPGQRLLDLCGGTGAVSLEALRRGADPSTIMLVDLNPRCPAGFIEQVAADANQIGPQVFRGRQPECHHSFDLIVVRQAAAYLGWDRFMVTWLATLLKPTGKLVFNTFVKPKWSLKTYKFEGRRYFEASGYVGRAVWHVQAAPGIGMDLTRFQWLSEEVLRTRLEVGFNVTVLTDGKSQRWICTPRGSHGP
jgi:SAM-dependent methyltransferase